MNASACRLAFADIKKSATPKIAGGIYSNGTYGKEVLQKQ
jgi:hypothetical protein